MQIDSKTGRRRLSRPNPYMDLDDFALTRAASAVVDELLTDRKRSPAERLALTERVAYLLIVCTGRLNVHGSRAKAAIGCPTGFGGPSR